MAKINALASLITLLHGSREAILSEAYEAFASDFAHFARANNRIPLNTAVSALTKGPKDKAIGEAIHAGFIGGGLVVGYIGAASGKFSEQPDDVKGKFEAAIVSATLAFNESLSTCEAFEAKAPKSDADQAKAKADKANKKAKADNALITAKIQAGELVLASEIRAFPQEEIDALKAHIADLQASNIALAFEVQTLQDALANATFQAAKPSKIKAPKGA